MNNLYEYRMSQYLPSSNFKSVNNVNEMQQKLIKIKSNSSTGYILEVDLEYPQNLHIEHIDYLLASEKINIPKDWFSNYCLEIASTHNIKIGSIKKLIPNVMNKNNYVIHYRNLQQCLQLGMKFKKVQKILKFKQKDRIKPYIHFNTQKRKEKTNDADKSLFNLLNNAVYGKTMKNMGKRIEIRIVKNEKDIIKHISKPTYDSHKIFDKTLVAIREKKICLTLNKLIYVGRTVLELSKLAMDDFHYDIMKNFFQHFTLLFADTDSLCYETNEDFYQKCYQHRELFDLSNSSKNSKYFRNDKKKLPIK